jgi:DNA-binding response OmpR family regulator
MEVRGMVLDGGLRRLRSGKAELDFTPQEWNLLFIFFSHPNRFLSTREILRLGWRAGDHAPEQLRTYVHKLRQKLCRQQLPCTLLSQHGAGYCLRFE